ncbi:hypothetical protein L1286_10565 [Pseudoalteromonas sp. SMS1]|uniref:hypothetical protein n=1 Tax=Pseudoalteromonas sp. SMS1 TaxID=2908894 RepID=UPI001F490488|nr:hypothetical protein [Pseudoalteromonas sp. SMS1]MCF2857916.1 hypothetical protein [Pseudoalteromonas sp. SMS1]
MRTVIACSLFKTHCERNYDEAFKVMLGAALLPSFMVLALAKNVSDIDRFERITNYASGPVKSVNIVSYRAHILMITVRLKNV